MPMNLSKTRDQNWILLSVKECGRRHSVLTRGRPQIISDAPFLMFRIVSSNGFGKISGNELQGFSDLYRVISAKLVLCYSEKALKCKIYSVFNSLVSLKLNFSPKQSGGRLKNKLFFRNSTNAKTFTQSGSVKYCSVNWYKTVIYVFSCLERCLEPTFLFFFQQRKCET